MKVVILYWRGTEEGKERGEREREQFSPI